MTLGRHLSIYTVLELLIQVSKQEINRGVTHRPASVTGASWGRFQNAGPNACQWEQEAFVLWRNRELMIINRNKGWEKGTVEGRGLEKCPCLGIAISTFLQRRAVE